MLTETEKKKQRLGLLYGLIAGAAFAFAAWGVDAVALARANDAFPWVKFIPGLLACVIAAGFTGWATIRSGNHLLGLTLWLLVAGIFTWLTIWLPLKSTPYLYKFLNPEFINWVDYPVIDQVEQFRIIGFLVLGLASAIAGLLEINLIESALVSSGTFSVFTPLIPCMIFFLVVGSAADTILNKTLREPVMAVDETIQFALDNEGKVIPPLVYRQKRLKALTGLGNVLHRKRTLTVIAFDSTLGQVDVLVDFDGVWVKCTTVYNQLTFCKPAMELPWIRLSGNWSANLFKRSEIYSIAFE